MTCVHLKQLYDLCQKNELKLGAADLIRVVCHQCNEQEVCPSVLLDEYEARSGAPKDDPVKEADKSAE